MLTVSLCVVAYNEEKHLPSVLNDILNQTYPHELIEIVLVNSASTDSTLSVMNNFKKHQSLFKNVVVAENPKKIQAAGWNVAIKNSSCDVIVRIDAHTQIPQDFVEKNILNLDSGEDVSGGIRPCIIEDETMWKKILLQAENSLFGSSVNKCRRSEKKMYVKTMFHAAYRRSVFEKAGIFNENLLRTEDNEIHYRIRQAGYKLCYDPQIVSYQYARNSLKKAIKQKFGNGYWIGLTLGVCPGCISLYHLVPFAFVVAIILTTILASFGFWHLSALMWSLYAIFAVTNTFISSIGNKFNPYVFTMPLIFLCLHISYGVGTMTGLLKMPFKRKKLFFDTKLDI